MWTVYEVATACPGLYKKPALPPPALPPFHVKSSLSTVQRILFEAINVPALYVTIQAVLSVFALRRTTTIVRDSGDGMSSKATHYFILQGGHYLRLGRLEKIRPQALKGRLISGFGDPWTYLF